MDRVVHGHRLVRSIGPMVLLARYILPIIPSLTQMARRAFGPYQFLLEEE